MIEYENQRDIEETEEVLDADVGDPVNFWEKKQKELVTSTVDYNLGTLADLVKSRDIDLSPEYQRRFRWDDIKKSKLIESFLMNVPVPPIFLNEDKYGQYSVIDGKQRLQAITEFFQGRLVLKDLKIFSDINGLVYYDLPSPLQTVIRTRPTLRAIIILRQSDVDIKFEVFQRLNTGGVQLNPQEIRNSTYPGPLNNMILELSINKKFHSLLGIKSREKSSIYKEMRDAELVLRYLTFKDSWQDFSGGIKKSLDRYMAQNERMPQEQIDEARKDFLQTLDVVDTCFGEFAFKRWLPERQQWRQLILASLFDAEMFACRGIPIDKIRPKKLEITEGLKALFLDDEFRRAIDAATNTPVYFRTRVEKLRNMLHIILKDE